MVKVMKYEYIRKGCDSKGWKMSKDLYAKCPCCGYYMSLNPMEGDCCPCGNLSKDADYGRFGARTGDRSIEIYKLNLDK